jgi:hypothetical protein
MKKGNASIEKLTCDWNWDALGSSPIISFNPDTTKDDVVITAI